MKVHAALVVAILAAGATGCATWNRTTKGAVIGAGGGRVIYGDDRNDDRYRDERDRDSNSRYENDRDRDDRGERDDRDRDERYENGRTEDRGSNGITDRIREILRGRDPNRYPPSTSRNGSSNVAYDNGFRDGLEKGREDLRDNDSFDPLTS